MDGSRSSFGFRNFGALDLGDKRRTKRLVKSADLICRNPGGTLPGKFQRPSDLKAFYHLMNCDEVSHEILMQAHTEDTRRQIAVLGATALGADAQGTATVLVLHDATELDYTTLTSLGERLGQIGRGTRRGYICHNSLAVEAATGGALGLMSQILHRRASVPKNEALKERRDRGDRESRLWLQGAEASGPAPAGVRCVDVSDSLSDTFEYMSFEVTHGRHFVLRAKENRCLAESVHGNDLLFDAVRAAPSLGERALRVQGTTQRKARDATLQVSVAAVTIAPPLKKAGEYAHEPLRLWAVRTWETNPPAGEEPLEWILLTNVPATDLASALERIEWYELRWISEEHHKGMKTGCGIETLQFTKLERIEPAIALLSVIALTLLKLRDAARAPDAETRPAKDVVDEEYVNVLADFYGSRLGSNPSVAKFYLHVARLGGHQNRKGDGFPGWLTLWRGWMRLQAMVDGYRANQRKQRNFA